jgi:hypothetical protein
VLRRNALALALVPLAAAGAASGAGPSLERVVLRPAQVGPGYAIAPGARERTLEAPTIDLCFRAFPSETRRVERLQIGYAHGGDEDTSNEVVRYRPGGAQQALRDLRSVSCDHKEREGRGGVDKTTMTVHRVSPKGAPRGSVTLAVETVFESGGVRNALYGAGVYQVRGNVLSGVYTYGEESAPVARAVRLAKISAANLRRAGAR